MRFDPTLVFARLDSPLLGSLMHVVGVAGPLADALVVAVRLFEAPPNTLAHLLDVSRLNLPRSDELNLKDWPLTPGCMFDCAREKHLANAAFRPFQLIDQSASGAASGGASTSGAGGVSEGASGGAPGTSAISHPTQSFTPKGIAACGLASDDALYHPLQAVTSIIDCYCLTFPVILPAWCMIAFFRCASQPAFLDEELNKLERLKLALARVIKAGYQRELITHHAPPAAFQAPPPPHRTPAEIVARLSKTERQVLSFLNFEATEKDVAHAIHRSPHTVHVHVKNIYRKLGIASREQLAALFEEAEPLISTVVRKTNDDL